MGGSGWKTDFLCAGVAKPKALQTEVCKAFFLYLLRKSYPLSIRMEKRSFCIFQVHNKF